MYFANAVQIDMPLARAGCKDIDDALHCTALPNGNYEVGVRILYTVYLFFFIKSDLHLM